MSVRKVIQTAWIHCELISMIWFSEFSVDTLDIVISEHLWDRNYRCEAFNGSGSTVDVTKTTLPAVVTSGRWTSQGK